MTSSRILLILVLVALFAGGGVWYAKSMAHKHQLTQMTDAEGKPQNEMYYTCPMHPQVKQDEPGNCPICGMNLVKREEGVTSPSPQGGGEKTVLYWYDPMKPEVKFDKPGKSPFMDMELVPKYEEAEGADSVQIDSAVVQNLGIRTAKVERGTFFQRVDTVGAVEVDERRIIAVESRTAAWAEQLLVRAVGDRVSRGQRLAGLYSPELFAAQQELALAVKTGDQALIGATRQRLSLLGVSENQIETLLTGGKAQRLTSVIAPASGIVTELNVREGQQVMPGTPLMRIADLSRVWITVEIPETQGAWIRAGREAEARLSGLPGQVFEGRVEYLYPLLDTQTRTVRARLAFDNPQADLKPGMFANVALFGGPRDNVLRVPTEAVIRTGERSVVILAEGAGRFRPAAVEVGDDREGQTEILSGLTEGEDVVVSGQFLIDSEANLRGALDRLAPREAQQP